MQAAKQGTKSSAPLGRSQGLTHFFGRWYPTGRARQIYSLTKWSRLWNLRGCIKGRRKPWRPAPTAMMVATRTGQSDRLGSGRPLRCALGRTCPGANDDRPTLARKRGSSGAGCIFIHQWISFYLSARTGKNHTSLMLRCCRDATSAVANRPMC